jgi:hypothetical protein
MTKKIFYLLFIFTGCTPAPKLWVSNVNDSSKANNSICYYALPQSKFAITVTFKQEINIPGPYFMYAKKYLGISDVITRSYERWSISDIQITHYAEADPDYLYSVTGKVNALFIKKFEELSQNNLILLPAHFASEQLFVNTTGEINREDTIYTNISVKRNFEIKKGVSVSDILPDSTYINPALSKTDNKGELKSTEQKAEEAANFIIKIRKRRFKLLAGQYDFMPDGEALGKAVEELNHTEEEYLSLFTGRTITTSWVRTFHYTPEDNSQTNKKVLFRFSENSGLMDDQLTGGKPLIIETEDLNITKALESNNMKMEITQNKLYYRIPDQAIIRIYIGEQLIKEAKYPVYQFGTIVSMQFLTR